MKGDITLCLVGAGGNYTPELIEGVLGQSRRELPIREIRMMDINPERLQIMAGLSRRMAQAVSCPLSIRSDTRLEPMLEGVDFVVTQIRVGGTASRRLDETIPLKYGVIGQETTGPGGMFKALRTIAPMLEIARAVERAAPDAFILNYTNPSGIITEAVLKNTKAKIIGLCSGIPAVQADLAGRLRGVFPDVKTYCVGLNHLGFIHRILSNGRDVTSQAIDCLLEREEAVPGGGPSLGWLKLARTLGAFPMPGYCDYFYHHRKRLEHLLSQKQSRAEQIAELERELYAEAAREETHSKPKVLQKRGGGGYSHVTFSVLKAILHDTGDEIAMSARNGETVEGIPPDAAVEVVCRVSKDGVTPLPVGPIPLAFRGLVQAVKAYETLTVEAAVRRDRHLALQALLAHPLVGELDVAEPLLDEMLTAHALDFS